MKFTGHERDFTGGTSAENSNYIDYMHARSTVPQWGRFLSVDPTWDSSDLASPQSWNRYSYVQNRPINFTDPDGRILDTVLDVAFVLYDLADIAATKIGGGRVTTTQELALGADVAATFIPFVTGAGIGVRAARAAAHAEDVVHVVEGAKDTGELLHHYGTAKKTVGTLAKKSAEAEGKIGEHGVSATTAVPTKPHTSASRAEVEKHFPVKQTGADPHNHTVVLPKPITQRVADLFNELFHRN
jgi:RHS repeat-associated protein